MAQERSTNVKVYEYGESRSSKLKSDVDFLYDTQGLWGTISFFSDVSFRWEKTISARRPRSRFDPVIDSKSGSRNASGKSP